MIPSTGLFSILFEKIIFPIFDLIFGVVFKFFIIFLAFVFYCFLKYQINPFKITRKKLLLMKINLKVINFVRWVAIDLIDRPLHRNDFKEFGLTIYCGRQGAGKTISMVDYLNRIHRNFPDCYIVTNFEYVHSTHQMQSWNDFFEIRNGTNGVVFAIDEIHSEYSAASSRNFPESLLSEISQQRKQKIKIVATAQVFTRVAKPLREQAFSVMICRTFMNRWTSTREYNAQDYELYCESENKDRKLKSFFRHSFVQSDSLRSCYDTYAKIERLQKSDFIPRAER